jgi:hypothetical protein
LSKAPPHPLTREWNDPISEKLCFLEHSTVDKVRKAGNPTCNTSLSENVGLKYIYTHITYDIHGYTDHYCIALGGSQLPLKLYPQQEGQKYEV